MNIGTLDEDNSLTIPNNRGIVETHSNNLFELVGESNKSLVRKLSSKEKRYASEILNVYSYGTDRQEKIMSVISSIILKLDNEGSRINVALYVAERNGRRVAEYFDLFNIQNEEAKINIAMICASTHARRLSRHINLFKVTDKRRRFDIAYQAAFNNGGDVLQYFSNYNICDAEDKKRLLARALLTTPHAISFINNIIGGNTKEILHTSSTNDIKQRLIETSKGNDSIITLSSQTLYDDTKRKDVGIRLLSGYVLGGNDVKTPKQSLELLTGLDSSLFNDLEVTSNSFGDFLEIVLDLQSKYLTPFFKDIYLDKSLFTKTDDFKKVIEFVKICNFLSQVRGGQANVQYVSLVNDINQELGKTTKVTVDNILSITKFLEDKLMGELMNKIKLVTADMFDENDLLKIKNLRGGDIEGLIALISRYSGKKEWHQAIPILIKIIRETLNGSFETYKYYGDENDEADKEKVKKQIGFLNQNQLNIRMENGSRVDMINHEDNTGISYQELIKHINQISQELFKIGNNYTRKDFGNILEFNDKDLSKRLKHTYSNNREHMLLHCLDEILIRNSDESDIENIKKIISKIKSLKDILLINNEIKNKIDELSNRSRTKSIKTEILFSTFFDDPKLMISINNLIRVTSCFNYTNGVEIQALMSYTIDSNIKGIAGFIISPADFSSFSEFQHLCNIVKTEKRNINLTFNQKNRELTIEASGTKFVIKLNNLFYKRFLKIGQTKDGEIGMKLELSHKQHNRKIDYIEEKIISLYNKKAGEMNVHLDKSIKIPQSRSILGSYSDISGGRKMDEYIME